jgi:hypothetical protein
VAEHRHPERTVASPQEIARHAAGAGRDAPAWRHGMHVWCRFGTSPGAARDRLSAVMEGFYQVPFGKFEKYGPCGTAGQIAESLRALLRSEHT